MTRPVIIATLTLIINLLAFSSLSAQKGSISGQVLDSEGAVPFASIYIQELKKGVSCNEEGRFTIGNLPDGRYNIVATMLGYRQANKQIDIVGQSLKKKINFLLQKDDEVLNEVIVTGTMKEVNKLDSPVPVEVYSPAFFQANPRPLDI